MDHAESNVAAESSARQHYGAVGANVPFDPAVFIGKCILGTDTHAAHGALVVFMQTRQQAASSYLNPFLFQKGALRLDEIRSGVVLRSEASSHGVPSETIQSIQIFHSQRFAGPFDCLVGLLRHRFHQVRMIEPQPRPEHVVAKKLGRIVYTPLFLQVVIRRRHSSVADASVSARCFHFFDYKHRSTGPVRFYGRAKPRQAAADDHNVLLFIPFDHTSNLLIHRLFSGFSQQIGKTERLLYEPVAPSFQDLVSPCPSLE